ncbi:MAG TPA: metal-dependent hydrolase [Pyrinomonadaceae bacterium]|nr:metal-dependent hydrolase [Pyrinomonadaceae bacterium]
MPTVFTHAFVAAAAGRAYAGREPRPARLYALAALCAVLPDADVLAFVFRVPYGSMFGHRGFTHSFAFALLLSLAVVWAFFRERRDKKSLALFFFLATASHPLLDMLTDGGLGVALLAPFSAERFFLPFRPVRVSPIGPSFFGERGLVVVLSELLWVWLPTAGAVALTILLRRRRGVTG